MGLFGMMKNFSVLTVYWVFTCGVLIGSSDCSNNSTWPTLQRTIRQVECDGFKCRNGECIDEDYKCDGKAECSDGSDETDSCKELMCRGNIFRCKYGACISKKLECDGKEDCRDGSDETSAKCSNVLNTKCKSDQFQCKNKQCISIDNKCDGTPHCTDLSDETEETCLKLACPGYTFKCKYGACISRKGVCNGISECFDGSDESKETCGDSYPTQKPPPVTSPTPATSTKSSKKPRPPNIFVRGSCTLPPKLDNGSWTVWSEIEYDYQPRDLVMPGTTIEIKCKKGFIVSETESEMALSICNQDTGWTINRPKCIQICSPIEPSSTTIVTCTNDGVKISCKAPIDGTTAKFTCPLFYELSTNNDLRFCSEGTWDDEKPRCIPVCGQKTAISKEMIIGGKKVKKGFYPWTIAIYKQNETTFGLVCGGSLITQRVVVTAAHCVTDLYGNKRNKELYMVAAGKYFRTYDHENDTEAEFSEVEEIFVYDKYKASTLHYEGDIAIIITKKAFNTSQFIQRICVDWDPFSTYEGRLLNTNGIVTGWGFTVRGSEPSEVLKEISLPYVDYNQCYDGTPDEYKAYVRGDKICAGYLDRGVGVCEGDSGGGLAFQAPEKNNRFYLRGIVSNAPQVNGTCNEYRYAFYTKVSMYLGFMQETLLRYKQRH